MADERALEEVLELADEIEGIILLDLAGLKGTWKEHLDDLYSKVRKIKALCGDEDAAATVGKD